MKRYIFYGWETANIKELNGLTLREYYGRVYGILRLSGNYRCFNAGIRKLLMADDVG